MLLVRIIIVSVRSFKPGGRSQCFAICMPCILRTEYLFSSCVVLETAPASQWLAVIADQDPFAQL